LPRSLNFVSQDKAYLLDLICRRYGGKPSDYLDLDEYESFQFDAAVAQRYYTIDNDNTNERLNTILNGITALMRALGVKNAKPNKYKRMIERPKAKAVDNITTAGISKFTVVETVTQERFGK
jgi:hypothetical protein